MPKRLLVNLAIVTMTMAALSPAVTNSQAQADETISVDVNQVLNDFAANPAGLVTDFLLDSDLERPRATSFEDAVVDMGVKTLRFPDGHMSNNYLWTTAPYPDDASDPLTPQSASMSNYPHLFEWARAGENDPTLVKDMDFKEFMQISTANGIEPVIVVNVMSYKYPGGPSRAELKDAAAEWVKYANETMGYDVKYWQLGNEQDHHSNLLDIDEYEDLYVEFVQAMKAVDPTIKTGPGLLANDQWVNRMLGLGGGLVDFMTAHQYTFNQWWTKNGYSGWRNRTETFVPDVENVSSLVANSSIPETEILITEINSWGGNCVPPDPSCNWPDEDGDGEVNENDVYRALYAFEMEANAISTPGVRSIYHWMTRSPWQGEFGDLGLQNIFDPNNDRKPTGELVRILNLFTLDTMVWAQRVQGYVRTWASYDATSGDLNLFLLNKDNSPVSVDVNLQNYGAAQANQRWVFKGTGPLDQEPTFTETGTTTVQGSTVTTELDPVSLTVITLSELTAGNLTYVDNTSPEVTYQGLWTEKFWNDYNGSMSQSKNGVAGSYVEHTFTGTTVDVGVRTGKWGGEVDVYLDGNLVLDDYDTYRSSTHFQQIIYSNGSLPPGPHTIRLESTDQKNPASNGTLAMFDFFRYTPTGG